ncbi:hypothetical protein NL676_038932 [Syzygium grande]|nr:hypothetical protein NL676_038932 [Syzygium grande]
MLAKLWSPLPAPGTPYPPRRHRHLPLLASRLAHRRQRTITLTPEPLPPDEARLSLTRRAPPPRRTSLPPIVAESLTNRRRRPPFRRLPHCPAPFYCSNRGVADFVAGYG